MSILQQSSAGSSITHCSLSLCRSWLLSLFFALFSFFLPNYMDQKTTPTGNGWSGSIPKEVYTLQLVQQKIRDFLSVSCGEYSVPYWGCSIGAGDTKWLNILITKAGSVIDCKLNTFEAVVVRRSLNYLLSIMENGHPVHHLRDRHRAPALTDCDAGKVSCTRPYLSICLFSFVIFELLAHLAGWMKCSHVLYDWP